MDRHDLERRLRADGRGWRTANLPEPSQPSHALRLSGRWWPTAAAAAVVVLVGGSAVMAQSGGSTSSSSAGSGTPVPSVSGSAELKPATTTAASPTQPPSQAPLGRNPYPLGAGPSGGPLVTSVPSQGTLFPAGTKSDQHRVSVARAAVLAALVPKGMHITSNAGEGSADGDLRTAIEYTDGSVSLTATWDRRSVPLSSTDLPDATSRNTLPDGTVVLVRDEPGAPEVLVAQPDGNSVDLAVAGDGQRLFTPTKLTSLAERLIKP